MSGFLDIRFQIAQPIPALTGEVFERMKNGIGHSVPKCFKYPALQFR